MNKKRLILVLTVIALLFLMSGCTIPTDANGNIVFITEETTFQQMLQNEGIFEAIFVFPLAKLIDLLAVKTNVGIAIVVVTILVNAIGLLITFRSSLETQKMQIIQPELLRIQKKYEGREDQNSKMRQAQEMQNVYKKYDVHPFRAILSQFIQYPILFAIYFAVRRSSVVATSTFLGLNLETTPMQGFQNGEYGYVILFAIMLAVQVLSMKVPMMLQEQKAKKEAEIHHRRYVKPENPMGGMMYAMVIFIGVLMFSWPSAMSLYYLVSSLVMIGKTYIMNIMTEKQMEKKA